jgi:DNA polymerase-3 subunit delta'
LNGVKHQSFAHRVIQKAIAADRVPHAYLFHGPDGVGKERMAQGLAQLLLCPQPYEEPIGGGISGGASTLRTGCQKCEECRLVEAAVHPDLHLVYRQLNRQHPDSAVRKRKALEISVDVLRHFLIERVGLTPVRGRAKLFIVAEADRMTVQAQNALLKTLEEPQGQTYLILLVSSLDRLLPTTLSRCQIAEFDALPDEFIEMQLAERFPELTQDQLRWYARLAQGSLGAAMMGVEDKTHQTYGELAGGMSALVDGNARRVDPTALSKTWLDAAKKLGEGYRQRDPDITDTESARRGLKTILQLTANCFSEQLRNEPTSSAADAVGRIAQAERQLDLNANTQLCIETLVMDLARPEKAGGAYV